MKQVIKAAQPREIKNRISVIQLELDYELATLFEAMQDNNEDQKSEIKQRLEKLRKEWLKLQA
ncbi:hypothetical protein CEF21_11010 [Bacillus sp. FJAT-42376]|uniref:hypothetical protein n=1 Tax=Bacillus sp. FJAT-42376 TaxID=2014076 RepID=UPI000F4DCF34|nr:hypothetical protein [Bacillus sp. FJAT-42376]AZB42781.1 hypothetical protein CEF21_11010 [Bacillus sp. FJAT-42376]